MRRHVPLVATGIAAVTLLVFARSIDGGFVDWDDDRNFVTNLGYRGLSATHLRWMFTTATMGHWIPVTWLTFGLDYVAWGMEPAGYHLTSAVLHALNAALVFVLARRLLGAALGLADEGAQTVGAAAAALLWALHPLRVESVAWVTERRDVVSGALYLLTVLTYLVAVERSGPARRRWLGVSLVVYALALMAKSIVMTLPVVLTVLDIYPLRRLPPSWRQWWTADARRVWREKLTYGALAGAGSVTALIVLAHTLPLTPVSQIPYGARPVVYGYDLAFYLWKSLVPVGLSPLYELPHPLWKMAPALAVGAALAVAVSVVLVWRRDRWPAGLAVWTAYAASIAPVGGLVHNGAQVAADRYTYLACLGWPVLVGGLVATLWRGRRSRARAVAASLALWLALLTAMTVRQIAVWRSSETLYARALAVNPACVLCQHQLGAVLANRGDLASAIEHFRRAAALRPDLVGYRVTVGRALLKAGRLPEAEQEFRAVIAAYPEQVEALTNLGLTCLALGRAAEARAYLERAVAVDPADATARAGLLRAREALDLRARPHAEAH